MGPLLGAWSDNPDKFYPLIGSFRMENMKKYMFFFRHFLVFWLTDRFWNCPWAKLQPFKCHSGPDAGIILWMRQPNERLRYIVTSSLIGWTHTQNDPCRHMLELNLITTVRLDWCLSRQSICRHSADCLNPLRANFFRGNINIYWHFASFLHIDMTQVLKILPQVRKWPTYSI